MGTGLFGKLPAHGDFVARGIGADLRAALDRWITRNLAGTERAEDAAEAWPEGGLRALLPLAGVAVLVLILPSRDRSGRRYPLAAVAFPAPRDLQAAEGWCDAAAAAIAAADQDGADALALALPDCAAAEVTVGADCEPLLWTRGDAPAPASEVLARLFGPVSSD